MSAVKIEQIRAPKTTNPLQQFLEHKYLFGTIHIFLEL